ncbi:hypothetical protein [Streptomyces sp. NBC_01262]|uniref:hypothetical protein n=1 Tax=Streptomyces sp. NBC_01262 TaxID=2903803 RepID=UPI002E344DB1|nr:hypothetical protein [Streptomyces sp. NBC_01262]
MTKVLSGERRGRSPDSSKRACSKAGYSTQIRSNGWRSRKLAGGDLLEAVREQMGRWPGRVARPEGHPGRLPEWAKLIGRALVVRSLGGRVGATGHGETVGFVDDVVDDVVGRMSG